MILALAERGASPDEAVKHFLRAADELPRASLFAVVVLLDQGHVSEAKTHLRNYLGRPAMKLGLSDNLNQRRMRVSMPHRM